MWIFRNFRWPFCLRSTLERDAAAHDGEMCRIRQENRRLQDRATQSNSRHAEELQRVRSSVSKLIDRLSVVGFQTVDDHLAGRVTLKYVPRYQFFVSVEIDPRLIDYGSVPRGEMDCIVTHICQQVERQLRESRFVRPPDTPPRPELKFSAKPVGPDDDRLRPHEYDAG